VLTDSSNGKTSTLPLVRGTLGAPAVDIGKLYKDTGNFTFDPGFVSTASCKSAITYIDGDQGVLLYRGYPIE
jgi:citrate synthase